MNKKLTICLMAFIFLGLTGTTFGRTTISIQIGGGRGYYYRPAPVIVAPPQVVYYPAHYYRPAYRPVYYRPAYCAPSYGYRHAPRHHSRHHGR